MLDSTLNVEVFILGTNSSCVFCVNSRITHNRVKQYTADVLWISSGFMMVGSVWGEGWFKTPPTGCLAVWPQWRSTVDVNYRELHRINWENYLSLAADMLSFPAGLSIPLSLLLFRSHGPPLTHLPHSLSVCLQICLHMSVYRFVPLLLSFVNELRVE
jgi:hypothetical protein